MIRFLERYGYPVSYTTSESVDEDPGQLAGHRRDHRLRPLRVLVSCGRPPRSRAPATRAPACCSSARTRSRGGSAMPERRAAPAIAAPPTRRSSPTSSSARSIPTVRSRRARSPTAARRSPARPTWGASRLGCGSSGRRPTATTRGPPAPGLRPFWLYAHTRMKPATTIPGIVGYELDTSTAASPRESS